METTGTRRSLLLVHAHPDDESIFTGATMARYAAEGCQVTLVTCTMGERGFSPSLRPGQISEDGLAELRAKELTAACGALGVTDYRFLGGAGRWRDSGPGDGQAPGAFHQANAGEAANELSAVIAEIRPQVVVTYDSRGFYGHPDHVKAHQVTWDAYRLACSERETKFYAVTIPVSVLAQAGRPSTAPEPPQRARPGMVRGPRIGATAEEITTEIDASAYLPAKLSALRSHATQVQVREPVVHVPVLGEIPAVGTEYYLQLAGPGGARAGGLDGRYENDLFHGL